MEEDDEVLFDNAPSPGARQTEVPSSSNTGPDTADKVTSSASYTDMGNWKTWKQRKNSDGSEFDKDNLELANRGLTSSTSNLSISVSSQASCSSQSLCPEEEQGLFKTTKINDDADAEPLILDLTQSDDEQVSPSLLETEADMDRDIKNTTALADGNEDDSRAELHASFDVLEEARQQVEDKLVKMTKVEQNQLEKFGKLKKFTAESRIFPPIRFSGYHTVAFLMQESFNPKLGLKPHPKKFQPRWTPDFVPMPCCVENERVLVKVINYSRTSAIGGVTQEPKKVKTEEKISNWNHIRHTLSQRICSCDELNDRINSITQSSVRFNVLKHTIEVVMSSDEGYNFFADVLPFMIELCLDLPKILTCPIPLLKRYKSHSISMTQLQIASLMANAFFCTFPTPLQNEDNYPSINFNELYTCDPSDSRLPSMANKLRCIIHYFERLFSTKEAHNGVVTFTRKSHISVNCPNWDKSTKKLNQMVCLLNGTIETEGTGMLQVDFANKYVGGGVLGRGAVQEEILFVIYPELLVSRLFTEKLFAGEALLITGCERFSKYYGYSSSFIYGGNFVDGTPFDRKGRRQSQIVAIDALFIRKNLTQFNPRFMERELNKAYAGFSFPVQMDITPVAVASGKWGCGAFNGNPELKTVIQLLAATESGRDLAIFVFEDAELQETLLSMYELIKDKTVGYIWTCLKQYHSIFCAQHENDDHAVSYTLSQFLAECLSVQEVDMAESPPASNKTISIDSDSSSNLPPKPDDSELDVIPASPEIVSKSDTIIEIDDTDNGHHNFEYMESSRTPKTPTKSTNTVHCSQTPTKRQSWENQQPPLADLYTPTTARGTPSKIGVIDLDRKQDLAYNCMPLVSTVPDVDTNSNPSVQSRRIQRLLDFANSPSDEDEEQGRNRKLKVEKIVTDSDYHTVFSSPTKGFRISKNHSVKRKLEVSPTTKEPASRRHKLIYSESEVLGSEVIATEK